MSRAAVPCTGARLPRFGPIPRRRTLRDAGDWDKQEAEYKSDVENKQKAIDSAKDQLTQLQEDAHKAGIDTRKEDTSDQDKKDTSKDDDSDKK